MTIVLTENWSGTVGAAPTGWTVVTTAGSTSTLQAGGLRETTPGSVDHAVTKRSITGTDLEVAGTFITPSSGLSNIEYGPSVWVRATGHPGGSQTGYFLGWNPQDGTTLLGKAHGSFTTTIGLQFAPLVLSSSTTYHYRFRTIGSKIQGRTWTGTEPSTWDLEVIDTDWTAAGDIVLWEEGPVAALPTSWTWGPLTVDAKLPFSAGTSTGTTSYGACLKVEFSPTSGIFDSPTWVDITNYVRSDIGISIRRGRSTELDRFQSGSCSFTLENGSLLFDPAYVAGTYFGYLLPMRQVRISAGLTSATRTNVLFRGFIKGWPQIPELGDQAATVEINAVDGFELLNLSRNATFAVTSDLAGNQVGQLLDQIDWPADLRNLDVGDNTLQSGTVTNSVLTYLQSIEDSDDGFFFMSMDGKVTFRAGSARSTNTRMTTTQFTLSDLGNIPYSAVKFVYDTDHTRNFVSRTNIGGTEQTAQDDGSILAYGLRSDVKSNLLLMADADALALATAVRDRNLGPYERPEGIVIPVPKLTSSQMTTIFGAELLDRVVFERRPMGQPVRSLVTLIQSIEHQITDDDWQMALAISASDIPSEARVL